MKLLNWMLTCSMALFTACDETVDEPVYFIGDSIVRLWDIDSSLPSLTHVNMGKSGSGIRYVESLAGTRRNDTVVVLIGTNDLFGMHPEDMASYCDRYLDAVCSLGASDVYLFSVLPREGEDVNTLIRDFNSRIRELATTCPSVVYMPVYDRFIIDGSNSPNPQLFTDGLHLSWAGYEMLAAALENNMRK